MQNGQKYKYYIHSVLWNIIMLVSCGSVAQTFLLEFGFSEKMVTSLFSIMQIVQIITIFFFSKFSDQINLIAKTMLKSHLLDFPLCLLLLALCFIKTENVSFLYFFLILAGSIFSISVGIHNVLTYKLPYQIIDMRDYGSLVSISGALIGIFSVGFTIASFYVQTAIGYLPAMTITYLMAIVLWIIFLIATGSMKEKQINIYTKTQPKIKLFQYKLFTALILPNVMRGFCLGIVNMAITIGYYSNLIDGESANYVIILTNALQIVGSFIFSKITMVVPNKLTILISSIIIAISLPFLTLGNTFVFLIIYTIVYFCIAILSVSVPVTVANLVDYKVAGQYAAGRMLLNTLGTSLAGFLCIPLFDTIGLVPTLILAGIMQLLSGLGYYFVKKTPAV